MAGSLGEPELNHSTNGGAEHILLDIDFDGARYLLIKMPLADRKCMPLSRRELEIVRMVAQGHPNKVIAVVLNISSWTVCTHLRRIFAKLGVGSRAAMVARATELGGFAPQKISLDHSVAGAGTNSFATELPASHLQHPTVQQHRLKPSQLQSNSTARRLDELGASSGSPLDLAASERPLARAQTSPSKRKVSQGPSSSRLLPSA
jgi:DNA-binding CsgD family transcriptional regulator